MNTENRDVKGKIRLLLGGLLTAAGAFITLVYIYLVLIVANRNNNIRDPLVTSFLVFGI